MPGQCHSRWPNSAPLSSPLFSPLTSFISLSLFSFVWPCPIHFQTFPLLFPQSRHHSLLADNTNNPTNHQGLIPAQTPPTLTSPPALLIPPLALALIAVRQQVHRTSFPCRLSSPLVDFLHLISAPANTTSRPTPARRSHSSDSTPSDKTKSHRSKGKKGSIHADVIDRLDFTGVGPSTSLFGLIIFHSSHFFLLLFT